MADHRGRGRRRLTPTPIGCAIWIIALLVLLIILSVLFGGFQLGTKAGSIGRPSTVPAATVLVAGSQPRLAQL
jgi:hypothetical protein